MKPSSYVVVVPGALAFSAVTSEYDSQDLADFEEFNVREFFDTARQYIEYALCVVAEKFKVPDKPDVKTRKLEKSDRFVEEKKEKGEHKKECKKEHGRKEYETREGTREGEQERTQEET